MKKIKVLVMGSNGFLASRFSQNADHDVFNIKLLSKRGNNTSLTLPQIRSAIKNFDPDVILNTIGVVNIDLCEAKKYIALEAHVLIPIKITNALRMTDSKAKVIHISTDHVYNDRGFSNESSTNPINVYAQTKLVGEMVYDLRKDLVLRTSFVGKNNVKGLGLTDWLFKNLKNNKYIDCFSDVFFSPLYVDTLIWIIKFCITNNINGLYNIGSNNKMSKLEFALEFARLLNLNSKLIKSIKYSDFKLKFKKATIRPLDMSMSVKKFSNDHRITFPPLKDELAKVSKEYEV